MMVDVCSTYAERLTHNTLFGWHEMLLSFDNRLEAIGSYRQHEDAMQIVSGRIDRPVVNFEAPPSSQVQEEMEWYGDWFSQTSPGEEEPVPALTRAGLSHLYFEIIHPFDDGNGCLGRALAEKSLAQNIGQPSHLRSPSPSNESEKTIVISLSGTRRHWTSHLGLPDFLNWCLQRSRSLWIA